MFIAPPPPADPCSSGQNLLDVAHPVQHSDDLNRLGVGVIDNQVRVEGPEFDWPARQVLADVTNARLAAEKANRSECLS
jgi:hypothetical protein